jgi:nickel-type superoxide dismutase maturation protease
MSRPGKAGQRSARFGFAVVRGDSMLPVLRSGDRLLVRYGADVRPGNVVVARFPDGVTVIKRAVEARPSVAERTGWWLLSDNLEAGTDSRHRGPVADEKVIAVATARVWPSPRLL